LRSSGEAHSLQNFARAGFQCRQKAQVEEIIGRLGAVVHSLGTSPDAKFEALTCR
jgi:hypothetical protein